MSPLPVCFLPSESVLGQLRGIEWSVCVFLARSNFLNYFDHANICSSAQFFFILKYTKFLDYIYVYVCVSMQHTRAHQQPTKSHALHTYPHIHLHTSKCIQKVVGLVHTEEEWHSYQGEISGLRSTHRVKPSCDDMRITHQSYDFVDPTGVKLWTMPQIERGLRQPCWTL